MGLFSLIRGPSEEVYDVYCQNPGCGREMTDQVVYMEASTHFQIQSPRVYCQVNCVSNVFDARVCSSETDQDWLSATLLNPKTPKEIQRAIREGKLTNHEALEETVDSG